MEQYISKSTLVAEIDKGINGRNDWQLDEYRKGYHDALTMFKKYLSTLKVKDVDLDFMLHEYWNLSPKITIDCLESATMTKDEMIKFAKHFFELGMEVSNKAQKRE